MREDEELPERLRVVGGNELEQRLVKAAGREQPSAELSERMARAIGIGAPVVGGLDALDGNADGPAPAPAPPAAVASGPLSSLLPWVGGAVIAVVASGVFVAVRSQSSSAPAPAVVAPSAVASAVVVAPVVPPQPAEVSSPEASPAVASPAPSLAPAAPRARSAPSASAGDLGEQIALVDEIRSALAANATERVLAKAREYQSRYPGGTFRPEVAAIRVEALAKAGRTGEARAQAERFLAAYGPGPLADRVRLVSGLSKP